MRFLARQAGPLPQPATDPQTRWTVLDPSSAAQVIAALDSLLRALLERARTERQRIAVFTWAPGA